MQNRFPHSILSFLLVIFLLTNTASAAGAGSVVYRNKTHLMKGLTYTNTVSYDAGVRNESFMLESTVNSDVYPIVLACDTIYGSLTINQMVHYAESLGYNVLAAVNSDFFSMSTGVPMGMVIENGIFKSSPSGNNVVAFRRDGSAFLSAQPSVTMHLINQSNMESSLITNFNKYRSDYGGLYLFSSAFSTVSTRTSTPGWMVKFKILDGTLTVSGSLQLEVVDRIQTDGSIPIGDNYLVLSAADECGYSSEYEKYNIGDKVTLNITCSDPNLTSAMWATGAGCILLDNGKITDSTDWYPSAATRNPRTALGIRADGSIVYYTIDGRVASHSSGITLQKLAEELLELGCMYAVNLDGGGSTAISLRLPGSTSTSVLNYPSDGYLRSCSTYILLVTENKPDQKAQQIFLNQDGAIVLTNSSISLQYLAMDNGFLPVTAPEPIIVYSAGLGSLDDAVYHADKNPGTDTIYLSANNVTGSGTIHVISSPTDCTLTHNGQNISSLTLRPGTSISLTAQATYYGQPVTLEQSEFSYFCSEDIGTISSSGIFTVANTSYAEGMITATCRDISITIPVKTTGRFSDVSASHWGLQYIEMLTKAGIIHGITESTFEPDQNISRGDFILMLYRACGSPAVSDKYSFMDVPRNTYYASAIAWARALGITTGFDDGTFRPDTPLTREQAFTLVYRAFPALGVSYIDSALSLLNAFSDKTLLADYAAIPTATLIRMHIVSGSNGRLEPTENLTRAQMSKILCITLYN